MEREFLLTSGGPFYDLLTKLHLRTPTHMRRSWLIAFLVWLPLAMAEVVRVARGLPLDPMMLDLSVHVRFLFTLPILLSSELVLEAATRSALNSLYAGDIADREALDRIIRRGERMRDSAVVEAILLGVAVIGGQLVLWSVFGPSGLFYGLAEVERWSFPRVWYSIVALPLVQFVMFRWIWRWVIWSIMLARIAKLPLTPLATHPDLAAGLGCLARPTSGFSGFVLATSGLMAAAWATQLLDGRVTVRELFPGLAAFLLIALTVAVAPLLLFCGHLFRARRRTLAQYSDFTRRYTLDFHKKWILGQVPDAARTPLGSPDIQSLSDLGQAYQMCSKTRVFVFGPRNVLAVWFAGMIPMIPLFASVLTVEQVLKRIVSTVLGGFPL